MDMIKVASMLDGIARKAEEMEKQAKSLKQRKTDFILNMNTENMGQKEYAKQKAKVNAMTEEEFKYRRYVMDIFLYNIINYDPLILFGNLDELNLIKKDSRIRYIGWLQGEDVYKYYLSSDVAIFPGTKSALWEQAICSGLPLICKRWKGMEYVDVGGNCIFIDVDDKEKIIESIKLLMNDKVTLENMRKIAKTKGYKRFSYERISRQAIDS